MHTDRLVDIILVPPVKNSILISDTEDNIPVGLIALLGSLENAGMSGSIFQPERLHFKLEDYKLLASEILDRSPGAIGFSTWCHSFPAALIIAEELKRLNSSIPVIFGGPQVSMLALAAMQKYPFIDYVLKGEADYSLPELLSVLMNGSDPDKLNGINGLVYRSIKGAEGTEVLENPYQCSVPDLDQLPIPEYSECYRNRHLSIDAGRGCPFQCKYCSTNLFFSRKFRVKSVSRIISEMDHYNDKLGTTSFSFDHDMLTLRKTYILDLCQNLEEHYKSRRKKYIWNCSARTDCVSEEMIDAMSASGCTSIFFGVESGSAKIQKGIGKNLDLEDAHKTIAYAADKGLWIRAAYIVGLPEETRADLDETIRSCIKNTYSGAEVQMTILSVLPGTEYYQTYFEKLEFDGILSGFSSDNLGGTFLDMVKEDKQLFSSFFYLPGDDVTKDELVMICKLVNQLSHYIPTIRAIWEYIQGDIEKISLLDLVKDDPDNMDKAESPDRSEISIMVGMIKKYLKYLNKRVELRSYIWEIFKADAMKAIVQRRYIIWQLIEASEKIRYTRVTDFGDEDMMRVIPAWRFLNTWYNIFNPVRYPLKEWKNFRYTRSDYQYLIVPLTDYHAEIVRLPKKFREILVKLKDMKVREYIQLCHPALKEKEARKFLKQLLEFNMVEIVRY